MFLSGCGSIGTRLQRRAQRWCCKLHLTEAILGYFLPLFLRPTCMHTHTETDTQGRTRTQTGKYTHTHTHKCRSVFRIKIRAWTLKAWLVLRQLPLIDEAFYSHSWRPSNSLRLDRNQLVWCPPPPQQMYQLLRYKQETKRNGGCCS